MDGPELVDPNSAEGKQFAALIDTLIKQCKIARRLRASPNPLPADLDGRQSQPTSDSTQECPSRPPAAVNEFQQRAQSGDRYL
jgi:hypothetical protein